MRERPEAMRLADALDLDPMPMGWCYEAAAELRRLHDEVESLRQAYNIVTDDCRNLTEKVIPNIRAQRDALLKALKGMLLHMGMDEDEWNKPTFDQARAAIKAAEGEET